MSGETSDAPPRRSGPARAALLAVATVTLLAAACGGSAPAGSGTGPASFTSQKMDVFAQCMRNHGEPDFYFSNPASTPSSSTPVLDFGGYIVQGIDPASAQFASAMKACQHLVPFHPPTTAQSHEQLTQAVKAAACMRTHGYPNWPDPTSQNGHIVNWGPPPGTDINSPQLQSAAKTCGEAV